MPTVLVAMFSPRTADKIMFLLKKHEYTCLQANDPATMKNFLKNDKPDLLLIHIKPQDSSIKKFIRSLKRAEDYKNLPVLAVLPKVSIAEIDDILNHGPDECLSPPFKLATLLEKLKELLENGIPEKKESSIPDKLLECFANIKAEGRLLRDICEVFSGASVSNHKARRMSRPSPEWTQIITNEALRPFYIGPEREYYLMRKQFMRKTPKPEAYEVDEKVLIKRTISPLAASVDYSSCAYSNELYGIQTVKGFSCATLACILNSRYAHFYFQRYSPPKEGLRDLYLSKGDILSLPIILPQPDQQKVFDDIYTKINSLEVTGNDKNYCSLEIVKLLSKLNHLIFEIFGFDNEAVKLLNSLHF